MCLVVGKPKGVKLPKGKRLRGWFEEFSDGFGVAFQYQGQVRILKGAMTVNEMFLLLDKMRTSLALQGVNVKDIDVVIQYRQAVTGSVCEKYCHPFPISPEQKELDSLDVATHCALAHNGVIWDYHTTPPKGAAHDVNDAQEFIKDYLVGMGEALWNPCVQQLIQTYTESKFALLTAKEIIYIGTFIEDGGLHFSNPLYKFAQTGWGRLWSRNGHSTYYEGWRTLGGKNKVCEFCETPVAQLYYSNDMDSNVCFLCFQQLSGYSPIGKNQPATAGYDWEEEEADYSA